MEIATFYEKGRAPVTVFQISGDITVATCEQLEQQSEDAVRDGTQNLLLDLSDVRQLSSAGLRAIHRIFNMLRTDMEAESDKAVRKGMRDGSFKSPHLKLLSPSEVVFNTLSMAGFDMFLEIHTDRGEAISSF